MLRYLCGTPDHKCGGTTLQVDKRLRKVHASSEDAFACFRRYLISMGYTSVGPRELASPDDGRVLVLTKKSKFGGALRVGKTADKSGKRLTFNWVHGHTGGCIHG